MFVRSTYLKWYYVNAQKPWYSHHTSYNVQKQWYDYSICPKHIMVHPFLWYMLTVTVSDLLCCVISFLPLFLCSYAYPLRYRFPWILLAIVAVNHPQSTMTTCYSYQSRSRPRGLKGECPREEGGVTLWIAIVCTRGMCVCVVRARVCCALGLDSVSWRSFRVH